jgi:hypothetical protein
MISFRLIADPLAVQVQRPLRLKVDRDLRAPKMLDMLNSCNLAGATLKSSEIGARIGTHIITRSP